MENGIKTAAGKSKWSVCGVKSIITNEKYIGDFLIGKHYTTGKIKRMLADKNLMDKGFDADFFRGVVEKITVSEGGMLCFEFLNGFKVYKQYERKVGIKNGSKKC